MQSLYNLNKCYMISYNIKNEQCLFDLEKEKRLFLIQEALMGATLGT